ncbi:TrkA domain-containing protein [Nocardia nova SH22a]|uniref:TrkA domain-containing protein n=1 Tax=Nocardia nova SH22a TaxID=1415166 RepID=W5TRL6_9NOCA|nr:NAD-binding protein [Nocardia nova]AHH21892.1 TrkA domain-containing protein [Nocardia nova SH22a]
MNVSPGGERSPTFVVCGDNPLVHQLALQLTTRFADATVTAVLPNRSGSYVPQLEKLTRVRILCAERLDESVLRDAGVERARALALVDQADVENFHTALRAHELNPRIRLVIRMFNTGLGFRIRRLFSDCVVLSISEMAAPSFIAAALGEDALDYLRLGERTLYVAAAGDAPPDRVIAGLAGGPGGITLRSARSPAGRVLALAERVPYSPSAPRRWLTLMRYLIAHDLIRLLMVLLVLIAGGCIMMVFIGNSWGTAAYETLLDAAGAAQPEPAREPMYKLLQLGVVFIGLTMTPVVTALVVGGVLRAQLADYHVDPSRMEDHVVVAGLGNVGMRVVEQLSDLGVPVVALDYDENARGIALARSLGVPVVIGQATWEDTLLAMGVPKARALVLLTSSDAVNLEAAMLGQSYRDDLQVVMRVSDDDLAERVQRTLGKAVVRSVFQLAAEGFAAAVVERNVIATLSLDHVALLVAEVPVEPGSALVGLRIAEIGLSEHSRVLAVQAAEGDTPEWLPSSQTVLRAGNQLVVVATRIGLNEFLERCAGEPDSEDAPEAGNSGNSGRGIALMEERAEVAHTGAGAGEVEASGDVVGTDAVTESDARRDLGGR